MKYRPYIIGIIIALLLEVTIFNFSALRSIGNTPLDLTSKATVEAFSDSSVIYHIEDVNRRVNNLGFTFASEDGMMADYTISLSDEGNAYPYELPKRTVSWKSPASFYTNVYSYGAVRTMDIKFENASGQSNIPWNEQLIGIYANVKRPMIFNWMRFLIVSIIILFFVALREGSFLERSIMREKWSLHSLKEGKGNLRKPEAWQLVVTILVTALWIGLGFFWSGSKVDFNEATKPHHQQYKELAQTLANGSVALPYEPSEELLKVENPYDTVYLQANNIEYLADYAYFNEKYYVYFGIVPELMFYLPYHLITGNDLANHYVVFAYYALFVVGVFLLFREVIIRYFKDVKFVSYILVSSFTVTAGTFAYIFFTADIYSVPIMGGLALSALGLWLWMLSARLYGIKKENARNAKSAGSAENSGDSGSAVSFKAGAALTIGSLCMAMVAGCRPQMLLFSLLLIPILGPSIWGPDMSRGGTWAGRIFNKKSLGRSLCIIVPHAAAAAVVMWYNWARFGSVWDFGATYSLTNNDMNLRGTNLSRMMLGLMTFLFGVPNVNGVFPYLQSMDLAFDYMGKMVTEHFFGGIIVTNVLTWVLAYYGKYRWCVKAKGLRLFMGISLGSALVIGLVDANSAGILQRYSADLAFGIILAVGILLLILVEQSPKSGFKFLKIGFWVELLTSLLIICNTVSGITLEMYNKELLVMVENLFRF